MSLEFTRNDVKNWLKKFGKNNNSAIVCAFRDWLTMYDMLDEVLRFGYAVPQDGFEIPLDTVYKIRKLLEDK